MRRSSAPRVPATTTLLYWLLLLCGLAMLTIVRIDTAESTLPIWIGSVVGTGLGQIMAWRRVRFWLAMFLAGNLIWIGPVAAMPLWEILSAWHARLAFATPYALAFVPAALCGYFSLTERGGLFAFWFPSVLWMVSILDRQGGESLGGAGWALPGALAALLIAFVHARETRRVALWQGHADMRIATPRSRVVLRATPARAAGRLAWMAGMLGATLALAAWVAPHLWYREVLDGRFGTAALGRASAVSTAGAHVCCAQRAAVEDQRRRVEEYLPIVRPYDEGHTAAVLLCTVCRNDVPVAGVPAAETDTAGECDAASASAELFGQPTTIAPGDEVGPGAPTTSHAAAFVGPPPAAPEPARAFVGPPANAPEPGRPPKPALDQRPATAKSLPATGTGRAVDPVPAPIAKAPPEPTIPAAQTSSQPIGERQRGDAPSLAWMVVLAVAGMALHLVVRPLRRWLTLRHLAKPIWAEAIDQRVSNLWQLALIGLRDAGWRAAPGEQPQELARRIGLEGIGTCAAVLERVRHGMRIEPADLEAMARAASLVYRSARSRIGWLSRAASWLRWPLV